ncbi:MAG: FHA domain-containing protein, partial [Chloroflexota bacterium]
FIIHNTVVCFIDELFCALIICAILVADSGEAFDLPSYSRVTIGRKVRENHTTLDLEQYKGSELNVSRRHAELLPWDGKVTIQDLHSVMGTWLNGEKLVAGQRYPLAHGDKIQLGQMRLHVVFSKDVLQSA